VEDGTLRSSCLLSIFLGFVFFFFLGFFFGVGVVFCDVWWFFFCFIFYVGKPPRKALSSPPIVGPIG